MRHNRKTQSTRRTTTARLVATLSPVAIETLALATRLAAIGVEISAAESACSDTPEEKHLGRASLKVGEAVSSLMELVRLHLRPRYYRTNLQDALTTQMRKTQ
jgi:hypothetical protein